MAIGTPTNRGTAQTDTSQSTLPVTTTGAVASGSKIILSAGWRTATTLSSVAGGGLTWTIDTQRVNVAATQHCALISADAPSGLASGTVITLTFSGNTTAKTVSVEEVTGLDAQGSVFDKTTGADIASGTSFSTGSTATTAQADELLMGIIFYNAVEASTTWTGSFTALQHISTPTRSTGNAYRIVSSTGAYAATGTFPTSSTANAIIGTYKAAVTPTTVTAPVGTGEVRGLGRDGFWNNAEGGSNGTTVSFGIAGNTGGTSGDYFDTGNTAGGLIFDSAQKAHGSLSYQVTSSPAFLERNRIGVLSDGYCRDYCRISALPSATRNLVDANLGGSLVWSMAVDTTGHILIRDGTLTTRATSTSTVSAGSWFRLEAHHNSSAELVVRLYTSMDSTTITETLTASSGTAGTIDKLRWTNSESGGHVVWHDDTVAGAKDWPGPYVLDPGLLLATMIAPAATGTTVGVAPVVSETLAAPVGTASGVGVAPTLVVPGTTVTGVVGTGIGVGVTPHVLGGLPIIDTYTRTVASGWSDADTGQTWTARSDSGAALTSSVNGSEGLHLQIADTSYRRSTVSVEHSDVEALVRIGFTTVPTASAIQAGVQLRLAASGLATAYYFPLILFSTGVLQWQITYANLGATSAIAGPATITSSYTAGDYYWCRCQAVGSRIRFRVWKDGTAEPSAWTSSITHSSVVSGGLFALYNRTSAVSATGLGNTVFDDLAVNIASEVTAPVGTGSAAGVGPVISETLVVPVGTASAVGVVPTLISGGTPVTVTGVVGTGTAAGVVPTLSETLIAPVGTASGSGVAPSLPLRVAGVVGTGAGVGVLPALRSTLLAPVATGVAVGFAPGLVGPAVAPVATGTAIGVVPTLRATVLPPVGGATAVGVTPSVIGPQVAAVGSGTAVGIIPIVSSRLAAPVASGSGVGVAPSLRASMLPAVATATAVGIAPFLGAGTFIAPPVGTGTAVGRAPTLIGPLAGVVATGTATGVLPTLRAILIAPLGTASGVGRVPTLTSGVAPIVAPLGTGSAVGIAPTLRALLVGVVGTGTAVGRAPLLLAGTIIAPPLGTGSATGRAPVLLASLQAPVGTATATGLIPRVVVLVQAPVATGAATGLPSSLLVTVPAPMGTGIVVGFKPLLILPGSLFDVLNEPWQVAATNEAYQAALQGEPSAGTVGSINGRFQVTGEPYQTSVVNRPDE